MKDYKTIADIINGYTTKTQKKTKKTYNELIEDLRVVINDYAEDKYKEEDTSRIIDRLMEIMHIYGIQYTSNIIVARHWRNILNELYEIIRHYNHLTDKEALHRKTDEFIAIFTTKFNK